MKKLKVIISLVLVTIILLNSTQLLNAKKPDDPEGGESGGSETNQYKSIQVETYNAEDKQIDKKINPEFRIKNIGSEAINLGDLELRYFFSIEGETHLALNNFNQPLIDIQVIEHNNDLLSSTHYLSVTFDDDTLFNPGETETFSFRIIQEGSGSLVQANDYSFNDNTTYTIWNRVSGYLSGYFFYGDENLFGQPTREDWNATENQIFIKWSQVEGATGYELKIDGQSTILGENQLDYYHTGLEPGTTHTYQIRPVSDHGFVGKWSDEYTIETLPDIPKNIQTSSTKDTIALTWDVVNGANSYDVEVFGIPIETITNSYVDFGLTPNTQYTYRVRAKNSSGTGKWSEIVAYTTLPDSSSGIWVQSESDEILVSWQSVAGAIKYELEIDGYIIEVLGTSHLHQQLETNTHHTYRVRAINDYGIGPWTQYIEAYTLLKTPQQININEINQGNLLDYQISWEQIQSATYYEIKIDGHINNTTSSVITHENISPNSQHVYQVRAMNENTYSNWSQEIIKTSTTDSPQNINAVINDSKLTITWDTVIGAKSYDLEINNQTMNVGLLTTYTLENINYNSEYRIRVRSVSDAGQSNWSDYLVLNSSLPAPTNLRAVTSSYTVLVYWDEVVGADMYELLIDGESYILGPRDNYTHSGLDANSLHVYRIRAFKNGQASAWSNAITVITIVSEPDHLRVEDVTSESIRVTWDEVFGAEGYYVEVDGEVRNTYDNNYYVHEDLKPNSIHKYRVRAYSNSGKSGWSSYIEQLTAPAIPKNLDAEATEESITLTWWKVPGAEKYEVEADGEIVEVIDERFEHMELLPNTRHEYRVRAFNKGGASEWSEILTKNTLPRVDINVGADNYFNFVFVVPDNSDDTRYISVYYNTEQLQVIDLCAVTPELETQAAKIKGTNIEVVVHEEGYILYKVTNVNKTFMNAIKFLALTNEHATVNYEIE